MARLSDYRRAFKLRVRLPVRLPRWALLLGIAGAVALAVNAFAASYLSLYRLQRESYRLEREVETVRRANAQLREEIRRLHSPQYIERLAREELGLLRPGEISVILVRPTPAPRP
jgi:cell division protein FtsL